MNIFSIYRFLMNKFFFTKNTCFKLLCLVNNARPWDIKHTYPLKSEKCNASKTLNDYVDAHTNYNVYNNNNNDDLWLNRRYLV